MPVSVRCVEILSAPRDDSSSLHCIVLVTNTNEPTAVEYQISSKPTNISQGQAKNYLKIVFCCASNDILGREIKMVDTIQMHSNATCFGSHMHSHAANRRRTDKLSLAISKVKFCYPLAQNFSISLLTPAVRLGLQQHRSGVHAERGGRWPELV